MSQAKRDENDVPTLLGVSSSDNTTPVPVYADPTTHRLLVDTGGVGTGITSINADGTVAQTLTVGTTGTDFAIVDNGSGDHKFNLPTASATNRGALSSADWTTFNNKGSGTVTAVSVATANGVSGTSSGGATPALTIALGNITPTSVAISGTGGLGFETLVAQASNPSAPAAGTLLIHSSTTQGFTRMEQDNEAPTNIIYGRDSVFIARNTSGGNFTKGQVVYVTGSTGNVPNVSLARANASTTLPTIGVCLDAINNNNFGQIMVVGIISGIDTSAFLAGDQLWVSTATAGGLQNTRPSGTSAAFAQKVGSVLVSNASTGSVLVDTSAFIGNMESGTTAATWTGNAVVATSYNGNTITTGTGTLTIAASKTFTCNDNVTVGTAGLTLGNTGGFIAASSKTLTCNNSLTLAGTDSTTMTFPSSSDTVTTIAATQTLTNKRITPRVLSATNYTTDTGSSIDSDTQDWFIVTAQAGALKFNNPSGTPTDGQALKFAVTGTAARALTWDTAYEASTVALPTTTATTARLNIGFVWRADTSKWVCVAVA